MMSSMVTDTEVTAQQTASMRKFGFRLRRDPATQLSTGTNRLPVWEMPVLGGGTMDGYVAGLPAFMAYFVSGVLLLVIFAAVYSLITPQKEFSLIRAGNSAAAAAFVGALLGFSLPLASAAANSVSLVDFVIWAVVGAILQLFAFAVAAFSQKDLSKRIAAGEMAAGVWAGGIALVVGLLNAACMTY